MWNNKIDLTGDDLSLDTLKEFRKQLETSQQNKLNPDIHGFLSKVQEKCPHLIEGLLASYSINGAFIIHPKVYDELESNDLIKEMRGRK